MTAADHVGEARRLIVGARAHLGLATLGHDTGPEIAAEAEVLTRSLSRLEVARRRMVARGWARFCRVVRRWGAS